MKSSFWEVFLKRKSWLLFYFLFLLVIIERMVVLLKFGFVYTDSDQTIQWLGLKEYSQGIFHEPRFYGQAYNSMIEALFAVPFYKMGVPAHIILPIITSLLALLPYVIIACMVYKKRSPGQALLIPAVLLLLPLEYSYITTISRGFVTGIAFTSIAWISVFFPKNKAWLFLAGLLCMVGFSLNSNAALMIAPLLLWLFLENIRNKYFYLFLGLGMLTGLAIHFGTNSFYSTHPFYVLHPLDYSFSPRSYTKGFKDVNLLLGIVTPLFWYMGVFILVGFIGLCSWFFLKRNWKMGLVVFSVPFLIVFSWGMNKVHDGWTSVFFSSARMYLSLPIVLGLMLSFVDIKKTKIAFYVLLILPMICFGWKMMRIEASILYNVSSRHEHLISVATVKEVKNMCDEMNSISKKYQVELVILDEDVNHDFYVYGCPACKEDFPNTLYPIYERRTWRMIEDENRVYKNILVINTVKGYNQLFNGMEELNEKPGWYLVSNNELKTMDLVTKLKIRIRPYK